jgi:bifunctional enzyme CysN/CysC
VDDGKSTLIGRLLYDSKMIFEDQLAALEADSKKVGTQGQNIDFALLVDGLAAEREQGITIDVAYRFFSTEKRKFIVADTPGHEQYTRNMVTGASTADLAVILIDARKGVLTQTRRHSYLVSPDRHPQRRAGGQQDGPGRLRPGGVRRDRRRLPRVRDQIGITNITADADVRLQGRQHHHALGQHALVRGPTLIEHLETVELDATADQAQAVPHAGAVGQPPEPGFPRLFRPDRLRHRQAGRPGPRAAVGPDLDRRRIVTLDGDLTRPSPASRSPLTLADEIDCSRGDVIAPPTPARGRRPVRDHHRVDGRRTRCCPAALSG